MSVSMEYERLRLLTDNPVARIVQREARQYGRRLLLLMRFCRAFQRHVTIGLMAVIPVVLIEDRLLPKVEAIDVTVAKIERPLMGLEGTPLRLTGYIVPNGESPRDD